MNSDGKYSEEKLLEDDEYALSTDVQIMSHMLNLRLHIDSKYIVEEMGNSSRIIRKMEINELKCIFVRICKDTSILKLIFTNNSKTKYNLTGDQVDFLIASIIHSYSLSENTRNHLYIYIYVCICIYIRNCPIAIC